MVRISLMDDMVLCEEGVVQRRVRRCNAEVR